MTILPIYSRSILVLLPQNVQNLVASFVDFRIHGIVTFVVLDQGGDLVRNSVAQSFSSKMGDFFIFCFLVLVFLSIISVFFFFFIYVQHCVCFFLMNKNNKIRLMI